MEKVCDAHQEGEWLFEDGVYYRYAKGELTAHIKGRDLPDPYHITEVRTAIANSTPGSNFRRKATDSVYKLWEHWDAIK